MHKIKKIYGVASWKKSFDKNEKTNLSDLRKVVNGAKERDMVSERE